MIKYKIKHKIVNYEKNGVIDYVIDLNNLTNQSINLDISNAQTN